MDNLRLYRALSRFRFMNYRAKIMIVAFLGTHVPLVALVANVASKTASDWQSFIGNPSRRPGRDRSPGPASPC